MKKFSLSVALLTAFLMSSGVAHAQNCDEIASSYLCGNRIPNILVTAPRPFWTHGANLHGILGALNDAQLRAFTAAATNFVLSQLVSTAVLAEHVEDRQEDAAELAAARAAVPEIVVTEKWIWRSFYASSSGPVIRELAKLSEADLSALLAASVADILLVLEAAGVYPLPTEARIRQVKHNAQTVQGYRNDVDTVAERIADYAITNCTEIANMAIAAGLTIALAKEIHSAWPIPIYVPPHIRVTGVALGFTGFVFATWVCTDED